MVLENTSVWETEQLSKANGSLLSLTICRRHWDVTQEEKGEGKGKRKIRKPKCQCLNFCSGFSDTLLGQWEAPFS